MAAAGPFAVPRCPPGRLPALLPVPRGRAQVPVDPKSGAGVRGLQLARQGAVFPRRVL